MIGHKDPTRFSIHANKVFFTVCIFRSHAREAKVNRQALKQMGGTSGFFGFFEQMHVGHFLRTGSKFLNFGTQSLNLFTVQRWLLDGCPKCLCHDKSSVCAQMACTSVVFFAIASSGSCGHADGSECGCSTRCKWHLIWNRLKFHKVLRQIVGLMEPLDQTNCVCLHAGRSGMMSGCEQGLFPADTTPRTQNSSFKRSLF